METLELKGACDYPKISDEYRNVYYRKTKQRPAEKDVNHQFIVSRDPDVPGTFEFGPLLNNRERPEAPPPWEEGQVDENGEPVPEPADPPAPDAHHPKTNVEKLRVTNNGLFDCDVTVGVRLPADEDGNPLVPGDDGIFTVEPESMRLAVDETRELLVCAYPKGDLPPEEEPADGEPPNPDAQPRLNVKRAVVFAKVAGNPNEFEFPMSCVGVTPAVDIDWPHERPVPEPKVDEEGTPVEAEPEPEPEPGVFFDRTLCGSRLVKKITLRTPVCSPSSGPSTSLKRCLRRRRRRRRRRRTRLRWRRRRRRTRRRRRRRRRARSRRRRRRRERRPAPPEPELSPNPNFHRRRNPRDSCSCPTSRESWTRWGNRR